MNEEYISPSGRTWSELRAQIFTPEEIAASDKRIAKICKKIDRRNARRERLARFIAAIARVLPSKARHDGTHLLKPQ